MDMFNAQKAEGFFDPVVDATTAACRARLPWWQPEAGLKTPHLGSETINLHCCHIARTHVSDPRWHALCRSLIRTQAELSVVAQRMLLPCEHASNA